MTTSTLTPRNRSRKPACGKALADHQFVGCLERTAATETWESHAPDGRRWLVKVLFNVAGFDPRRADALRRLRELRHPHLVPSVVSAGGPGSVVVASPYPNVTLFDLLQQYQADGEPGLPRDELLGWLRVAAATLDAVSKQSDVSHLALTPRHLVLADERLAIADFGLAQLLWLPNGQFPGQVQPRYAAPELPGQSPAGRACDQFSLAAVYQELLTGTAPFRGRPAGAPNLEPLPASERVAVARALNFDPRRRFATCEDFISALEKPVLPPPVQRPAAEAPPLTTPLTGEATAVDTLSPRTRRPSTAHDFVLDAAAPDDAPKNAAPAAPATSPDLGGPKPSPTPSVKEWLADRSSIVELDAAAESEEVESPEPPAKPEPAPPLSLPDAVSPPAAPEIAATPVESPIQDPIPVPTEASPPLEPPVSPDAALSFAAKDSTDWEAETPLRLPNFNEAPTDVVALPAPTPAPDEAAPPVEPTRLLNESQPSAIAETPVHALPRVSDRDDDDPQIRAAVTMPMEDIFPEGAPGRGTDGQTPPEGAGAPERESVPPGVSPFDPNFVPSAEVLNPARSWPFGEPPAVPAGEPEGAEASTVTSVAVEERPVTPALDAPAGPFAEAPAVSTVDPPALTFKPFFIHLHTSTLQPGRQEEQPVVEATAKAETPKPIFRALRSIRPEGESDQGKKRPSDPAIAPRNDRQVADLTALLRAAAEAVPPNEPERWLTTDEEGEVLECRFPASLPPSGPPIDFGRFSTRCNGQLLSADEDTAVFLVGPQKKFWKRLLSRPVPLHVEIRWSRPRPPAVGIPGVIVRVRLANKLDKGGSAALHEQAPRLVTMLRTQLQGGSERRREQRVLWVQPVTATFLLSSGDVSGTVDGQTRDLTSAGMGLYLPRILPGTQVSLRLTDPKAEPVTVIGRFVRVQRCGDGWYEVGVRFEP